MKVTNSTQNGKFYFEITSNSKCIMIEGECSDRKYVSTIELTPNEDTLTREMVESFTNATKVIIPYGIVKIGNGTFKDFYNLKDVILSSSVTIIGDEVFRNCKALKHIDLRKVYLVGEMAFESCYNLTKVKMSNVEFIGKYAFYNCYKLDNVVVPNAIKLEKGAFLIAIK